MDITKLYKPSYASSGFDVLRAAEEAQNFSALKAVEEFHRPAMLTAAEQFQYVLDSSYGITGAIHNMDSISETEKLGKQLAEGFGSASQFTKATQQLQDTCDSISNAAKLDNKITLSETIGKMQDWRKLTVGAAHITALDTGIFKLGQKIEKNFGLAFARNALKDHHKLVNKSIASEMQEIAQGWKAVGILEATQRLQDQHPFTKNDWAGTMGFTSDTVGDFKDFTSSSEIQRLVDSFQALTSAISAIDGLTNFPADYGHVDDSERSTRNDYEIYEDELPTLEKLETISAEVVDIISGGTDFNSLPDPIKKKLKHLYYFYILPLALSLIGAWIYDNHVKAQEALQNAPPAKIKAIAAGRVQTKFDRRSLKDHRIIDADSLSLRVAPKMSSQVIVQLPRGQLVEVLDGSEKSWLEISVEVDGEVKTGWISRKYTLYFRMI